jgi:UDP-N-acetylmuramate dehydrogenase
MSVSIASQVDLFPYNTFGMHSISSQLSPIRSLQDLQYVVANNHKQLPYFILGGGSNLLLTKDINAWVLKNECEGITITAEDADAVYIKVGGGVVWHQFVLFCIANNYCGVENLALIPGTVGAAPIQNIGAYGVEVKECIETVHTFNLETGATADFDNDACGFAYRESVFKRCYKNILFVYAVTFKLSKKPHFRIGYGDVQKTMDAMQLPLSINAVAQAIIHIRQTKLPDPKEIGNSGSFFKNPTISTEQYLALQTQYPNIPGYKIDEDTTKVPAGWLIEYCGWKGYKDGYVGVHPKQALVLVNYGGATGNAVYNLSEEIISNVHATFKILMEREVQVY